MKWTASSLLLTKTVLEQAAQFGHGRLCMFALSPKLQPGALAGAKHDKRRDAARTDPVLASSQGYGGLEPGGRLGKGGGGPQMQSEAIFYLYSLLRNVHGLKLKCSDPGTDPHPLCAVISPLQSPGS